jgi:hypothetical protein
MTEASALTSGVSEQLTKAESLEGKSVLICREGELGCSGSMNREEALVGRK